MLDPNTASQTNATVQMVSEINALLADRSSSPRMSDRTAKSSPSRIDPRRAAMRARGGRGADGGLATATLKTQLCRTIAWLALCALTGAALRDSPEPIKAQACCTDAVAGDGFCIENGAGFLARRSLGRPHYGPIPAPNWASRSGSVSGP